MIIRLFTLHIMFLFSFSSIFCQTIELQEALNYLNSVRSNPNAYSTEIGVSLIDVYPMHSLRWNNQLANAAQRKAQDMADRNYFGHIDPEGYGMNYFIQNSGYKLNSNWLANISMNYFESLSAGMPSPKASIIQLIKDEGVIGYGHRKHLLSIEDFWKPCYDIGIGWGYNNNSKYKTYCCVLIAKHDWNGDSQSNDLGYLKKQKEIKQEPQTTYNNIDFYKNVPAELNKAKYYNLISIKFGGSANLIIQELNNFNSSSLNQFSYLLSTMAGFNLGKYKKNSTIGLFANYGKYNSQNLNNINNSFTSSNKPFLEIEGGLILKEFLRLSGGFGYSSLNSIRFSSSDYTCFTAGFSFGPKWLKLDLANTIILPNNQSKIYYRPSIGLSVAFNMIKK